MTDLREPSLPPAQPFTRLQIQDGLLITADRWQQAHRYHRHRQNFQYQAMHQPGIVWGLGVVPIAAPINLDARDRTGRWVQIQPGVAIDVAGNPIIVPEPQTFQIRTQPMPGEVVTVILVINYVDPDDLSLHGKLEAVTEQFRIVEKRQMDEQDVELCRISLQGTSIQLATATNPFSPSVNQIDLRSRLPVRSRPQSWVRLSHLCQGSIDDSEIHRCLEDLMQSVSGLYPDLWGYPNVANVSSTHGEIAPDCDVVYVSWDCLFRLDKRVETALSEHLKRGGVMCVMAAWTDLNLQEFVAIYAELSRALQNLPPDSQITHPQLHQEADEIQLLIDHAIATAVEQLRPVGDRLGQLISGDTGEVDTYHPLRRRPFLFSQWPTIQGYPMIVLNWGGIVLSVGNIAQQWGLCSGAAISRESLRTAQEWGINLLHFARQRRHFTQLQQPIQTLTSSATQTLQGEVHHG